MGNKNKWLFSIVLIGLNIVVISGLLYGYIALVKANKVALPSLLFRYKIFSPIRKFAKRFLIDDNIESIMKEVSDAYEETFPTVWDGGVGINLSARLFRKTIMFGKIRYMYQPNLTKLSFILHYGKKDWKFEAMSNRRLKNLLEKASAKYVIESHFDSNGFRKIGFANTKNLKNILFVGDSFTEGLWVNDNETFVHEIGLLMGEENYGYPINAGVNGYGTMEEYYIIKQFANKLGCKMVVLNHYVNDISNNFWHIVQNDPDTAAKLWQENLKWLEKINAFCTNNDIKLVISAIPSKHQLKNPEAKKKEYYQKRLKEFCDRRNICFVDVSSGFQYEEIEKLYFQGDPHLSVYGHKLYAEILWRAIKKAFPRL